MVFGAGEIEKKFLGAVNLFWEVGVVLSVIHMIFTLKLENLRNIKYEIQI